MSGLGSSQDLLGRGHSRLGATGIGCLDCKKRVADVIVAEIATFRTRAAEFEENRDLVRGIIAEGNEKARDVARQTLEEVHTAMGMNYR